MEVAIVIILLLVLALYLLLRRPSAPPAERLPSEAPDARAPRAESTTAQPRATEASPSVGAAASQRDLTSPPAHPSPVAITAKSSAALADDLPPPSLVPSRDVGGMRRGLARSRQNEGIFGRLRSLIGQRKEISEEIVREIEEVLLSSDVGTTTTQTILERLRDGLQRGELADSERVWAALRAEAIRILETPGSSGPFRLTDKPMVILFVGVNGAGKTTTIGKLATKLLGAGHSCLLAAGDTFRAAAVQQLVVWGKRVGCEVVVGPEGGDPAGVLFDAVEQAKRQGVDVLLADTAGRLQTKVNLMREMEKIARSMGKAQAGAPHEILLVLDATNGQNALSQAREFKETLGITGIVLTKLDGTAKGGVVLGICNELRLPVRFVGLGERPDDLFEFSPTHFVEALLGKDLEAAAQ